MKFVAFFIVFSIFYSFFNWLINRTDLHNRLFGRVQRRWLNRVVFILVLFVFTLSLEIGQSYLNDIYGRPNYISLVVGAFLGAVYFNFVPLIFRRRK